jgi:KDO2-lipid IV(A) lauroyltransferase
MNNLAIAFPEKSIEERKKIAKEFYKQFIDSFIEVIKLISISPQELDERYKCDSSVIEELRLKNKNINLLLGHYFNWEFANLSMSLHAKQKFIGVYMPISNKIFDKLYIKIRSRFGTTLVDATNFSKEFKQAANTQYILGLIGDQNPGDPQNAYWVSFFNKPTPFVKGPEKGSRLNNVAAVALRIYRKKRGFYNAEFKLLATDAKSLPVGELTKQMVAFFEDAIRKNPSNYLWSHKRWKWEFDEQEHGKLLV